MGLREGVGEATKSIECAPCAGGVMSVTDSDYPHGFQELLLGMYSLSPGDQVHLDNLQSGICFGCGGPGRVYRRYTAYAESLPNYSCACSACEAEDYEQMKALWAEYHFGLL
jgi:hypothetical protein